MKCEAYEKCIVPSTGLIIRRKENMLKNFDNGFCYCTDGYGLDLNSECQKCGAKQGIDPNTYGCVDCPQGFGIDLDSNFCRECKSDEVIDEDTGRCICKPKYGFNPNNKKEKECVNCSIQFRNGGIDPETGVCRACNVDSANECIDPTTRVCTAFEENMGLDELTGECINCPEGATPDPETKICFCENGLGLDPTTYTCTKCNEELNYSIDVYTGLCRLCNNRYEYTDTETHKCKCSDNRGFSAVNSGCVDCTSFSNGIDADSGKCRKCNIDENEGIDPETKICRLCNKGNEGINYSNKTCQKCAEGSSPDANHHCKCTELGWGLNQLGTECIQCSSGQGLDKSNNKCATCGDRSGINPETRYCEYCSSSTNCIDLISKECKPIPEGQIKDSKTYKCKCKDDKLGISWSTGLCTSCPDGQTLITILILAFVLIKKDLMMIILNVKIANMVMEFLQILSNVLVHTIQDVLIDQLVFGYQYLNLVK